MSNIFNKKKAKIFYDKKIYSIAIFFILWQIISLSYSSIVLPSPISVIVSFLKLAKDWSFYNDLAITIFRGCLGYVISMIMALLLAILFYVNKTIKELLYPYIIMFQAIPRISWILLAMVWLPFNSVIVVFVLIITLLPTMVMNIHEGFENTDRELLDMARIFKVDKKKIISNIYIPSSLPYIILTSKVSLGIMWKTVIMIELLTVQNGLGARMGYLRTALATEQIIALTCIIILINSICQKVLRVVYSRSERWKNTIEYNKN